MNSRQVDNAVKLAAFITNAVKRPPIGPATNKAPELEKERAYVWFEENDDGESKIAAIIRLDDEATTVDVNFDVGNNPAYLTIPTFCLLENIMCVIIYNGERQLVTSK